MQRQFSEAVNGYDSEDLPDPDVLAQEIADDLQTALDQFSAIAGELGE